MTVLPKFNKDIVHSDAEKSRGLSSRRSHVVVKKPFYKRWWFIAGGVVVVFLTIGALSPDDSSDSHSSDVKTSVSSQKKDDVKKDDSDKKKATKAEKKSKELKTVSIGEPVRVGDVEYVVNSRNVTDKVGGDYINKTANGVYLIVNVTVKNLGDDSLSVNNNFFKLLKDNKEYESDGSAGVYANKDSKFFLSKINPESELTGNVVFDVTKETAEDTSLKLQVQTGAWGTQKGLINLD